MKTPRNLTQALKNGYKLKCAKCSDMRKIRVDVEIRNFRSDRPSILGFWLTKKYVRRVYPFLNV